MSTIVLEWPAGPGEMFAQGAFDSQAGKEIRVNYGGMAESGRLLKAVVADDGQSVRLTLEVPGELAPLP